MTQSDIDSSESGYSKKLGRFAIPLYAINRDDLSIRGSGFIIKIEDDHYLVTAKHVFDQNWQPGGVFISSEPNKFHPALGAQMHTGKSLTIEKDDQADISVVHLASDIPKPPYILAGDNSKEAGHSVAIDETVSALCVQPRAGCEYAVVGYPLSKNKITHARRYIQHNGYCHSDLSPESAVYKRLGLDEDKNILVKFDRKTGTGNLGNGVIFPEPLGMSGGPIFQIFRNPENSTDFKFSIAGILTSREPKDGLLQGTDISRVFQMIHKLRLRGRRK